MRDNKKEYRNSICGLTVHSVSTGRICLNKIIIINYYLLVSRFSNINLYFKNMANQPKMKRKVGYIHNGYVNTTVFVKEILGVLKTLDCSLDLACFS